MTQHPFSPAALRGAVDLSALKRTPATASAGSGPPGAGAGAGSPGGSADAGALVVSANDATFQEVVTTSIRVPVIAVLWSGRLAQSAEFVEVMLAVARRYEGRFQLASINLDESPGLLQAFAVQSVPMVVGIISGQPVPLFVGVQREAQITPWVDELLKIAVQNGITGRVSADPAGTPAATEDDAEPELPLLHQQAYDAIDAGDLDGAAAAFERAVADNPADADAALGLSQVRLLQRTASLDPVGVRAGAAADPSDLAAQCSVADLDVLGGHVEEAFARLVDVVRRTSGDERSTVRRHLLDLFEVVGGHDERVVKARRALMSALF